MKTNLTRLIISFFIFVPLYAKTMVVFNQGALKIKPLSSIDSGKIVSPSSNALLSFFSGASSSETSLSTIDSIRFYDAALSLTPEMLYNGTFAERVWTNTEKTELTLDLRNINSGFNGTLETDALDLLDQYGSGVAPDITILNLATYAIADTPVGTSIKMSYKTGNSFFSDSGWSDWVQAPGLNVELGNIGKRYFKLRFVLETSSKTMLPKLNGITICVNYSKTTSNSKAITVSQFSNEKIIKGAYQFGWETRDQAKIVEFINKTKLDSIAATKTDEFDKFLLIMDWVAKRQNVFNNPNWSPYPWNIDSVYRSDGSIKGNCQSYAEVLITALTGLGYYARHWSIQGLHYNGHEVVEAWSNKLKKWVYLDPSLDTYYQNKATKEPLSILEMHNIYVHFLFKPGEDLLMPMDLQNARFNNELGGRCAPEIKVVDKWYHYGSGPDYSWNACSQHGYTTCGFMRLTERNNFHSQYAPFFPYFTQGIENFNWYHNWMDEYTPPYGTQITNFSGRTRDFWYSLNQASIKAKRSGETTILLEFGQSQPFFSIYMISIDGAVAVENGSTYSWTIHSNENTITVTPEDRWGTQGLASTLKIIY